MPIQDVTRAGKPYRPSNGIEGEFFHAEFCDRCVMGQDEGFVEGCEIWAAAFWNSLGEPGFPKEWIFDSSGCPTCTAFEKFDVGVGRDTKTLPLGL